MSLEIVKVTRRFGDVEAVSNVSLSVNPGERVALLGHNGAGKTTLMKMILGLTHLDDGLISVFGAAPGSHAARAASSYLPENVAFHGSLTGREQLQLLARLRGIKPKPANDLLERVGLSEAADRRIATYSKGMRQRLGLAQALLDNPRVAILDEPTSGLDPISRGEFYDLVNELAAGGTAVLLSSHALTELEARTDRIAILLKGRLVANASLTTLRSQAHLPIRLRVAARPEKFDEVADRLGGVRVNGRALEISCLQDEKLGHLRRIAELEALIEDVEVAPPSLEDLYRHYSGRNSM